MAIKLNFNDGGPSTKEEEKYLQEIEDNLNLLEAFKSNIENNKLPKSEIESINKVINDAVDKVNEANGIDDLKSLSNDLDFQLKEFDYSLTGTFGVLTNYARETLEENLDLLRENDVQVSKGMSRGLQEIVLALEKDQDIGDILDKIHSFRSMQDLVLETQELLENYGVVKKSEKSLDIGYDDNLDVLSGNNPLAGTQISEVQETAGNDVKDPKYFQDMIKYREDNQSNQRGMQ